MLRSEIFSNIAENCSEAFGTTGEESEAFAYQKLVTDACDTYARKTRCFWQVSNLPIQANVARYCAPDILEMQCISLFTADGFLHILDPANEPAMDDWAGASWRNLQSAPQPNTIITEGLNAIVLSPPPSFNSVIYNYVDLSISAGTIQTASGIAVPTSIASSIARPFINAPAPAGDVGLFLNVQGGTGLTAGAWAQIVSVDGNGNATLLLPIGTAGSVNGSATLTSGGLWIEGPGVPGQTWEALNATCPLPDRAHMGVVWLASMQRVISSRTLDSTEKQFRYSTFKENYREACGMLEREARTITYASRVPSLVGSQGIGTYGAWDSTFGNPLDL